MNRSVIFSNTFYQLLARFGTVIFTFLVSIVLTRQLGGTFFGQYSVALNYIAMFYMLADFGVNILVVKDYSENENLLKNEFQKLLGLKIFLGLILTFLAIVLTPLLPYDPHLKNAIIFASILILFFSIQSSFLAVFQSKLQYWKSAVVNLCTGVIVFGSIYFYISFSEGVSIKDVVFLTVVGYFAGLIVSVFLTRTQVIYNFQSFFDWVFSKTILQRSVFLGLTIVLNSFMFSGDKFLLSLYKGDVEVGIYTLAYKLFELYLVVPTFVMNSYYPSLIKLRLENKEEVLNKIKKIIWFMIPVGIFSSLLAIAVGYFMIPLIWGNEMSLSVKPFIILILTSVPFFITAPLTWVYYMENYHRRLLLIYLAGFIFNLILNLIFIQKYSYIGSAYITALTEALVLILLVKGLNINLSFRSLYK